MRIVLASRSPRRQALLAMICDDLVVIPTDAPEASFADARMTVLESARRKAHAVGREAQGIVLGADTVVALDQEILGKPRSRQEAAAMLRALSGRTHEVLTGLCLWNTESGEERTSCASTQVRFRPITDEELTWYLDCGEYSDKAGAYGIQGRAAAFIEQIVGEHTNVMGLPLCELSRLLRDMGVGPGATDRSMC